MTNYCTKCACYFAQPGTCNCFAPSGVFPKVTIYPNTGGTNTIPFRISDLPSGGSPQILCGAEPRTSPADAIKFKTIN